MSSFFTDLCENKSTVTVFCIRISPQYFSLCSISATVPGCHLALPSLALAADNALCCRLYASRPLCGFALQNPAQARRFIGVNNKKRTSFRCPSFCGYTVRNSYASKFQYIRILLIKLIRYISSFAPKGLISPQF